MYVFFESRIPLQDISTHTGTHINNFKNVFKVKYKEKKQLYAYQSEC